MEEEDDGLRYDVTGEGDDMMLDIVTRLDDAAEHGNERAMIALADIYDSGVMDGYLDDGRRFAPRGGGHRQRGRRGPDERTPKDH